MKNDPPTIVVMHGDQTGEELLVEALRVLESNVIGTTIDLKHFDLSLEKRRDTDNRVVFEAAEVAAEYGLSLKAATITPASQDDVGSPNAILRKALNAQVILRTGRRIPNIRPIGGVHAPIAVVRMAVDDAYGAKEWRELTPSGDEVAFRQSVVKRSVCRSVAEFSFQYAARHGSKVFGGPKFTVSPVYEGMFKEELDDAARKHPEVSYRPLLIDATFALLLQASGEPLVIPAMNRDGDLLSDMVLQMYGTIAGSESLVLGLDEDTGHVRTVMAEAPHGTAPALQGKNLANPMAMILASAALLEFADHEACTTASRAIYESVAEVLENGWATPDLGGQLTTSEFVDAVVEKTRQICYNAQ